MHKFEQKGRPLYDFLIVKATPYYRSNEAQGSCLRDLSDCRDNETRGAYFSWFDYHLSRTLGLLC